MGAFIDLTGNEFGSWRVVGPYRRSAETSQWWCVCACGEGRWVNAVTLKAGTSRSCGCAKAKGSATPCWPLPYLSRIRQYKADCKRKFNGKRVWALTNVEAVSLVCAPCFYCGEDPLDGCLTGFTKGGIDRIDSGLGYLKDNCVGCCKTCNAAKSNMSVEQFWAWIQRVHEHVKSAA